LVQIAAIECEKMGEAEAFVLSKEADGTFSLRYKGIGGIDLVAVKAQQDVMEAQQEAEEQARRQVEEVLSSSIYSKTHAFAHPLIRSHMRLYMYPPVYASTHIRINSGGAGGTSSTAGADRVYNSVGPV
jgi:hypothetical protein